MRICVRSVVPTDINIMNSRDLDVHGMVRKKFCLLFNLLAVCVIKDVHRKEMIKNV